MPYNEQAKYQAFEDDYYSAVNWTQSNEITYQSNDTSDKARDDTIGPGKGNESIETHFVTSHRASVVYRNYGTNFLSKNTLYQYLKAKEYKSIPGSSISTKRKENKDPVIVKSRSTDKPIYRYTFRRYRYVVAQAKFSIDGSLSDIYFDTSCIMSLIDRQFLYK